MGKYEIEMEIKGFRLRVKGERAEMQGIAENLQAQIPRLLEPALNIPQGYLPGGRVVEVKANENEDRPHRQKATRSARRTGSAKSETNSGAPNLTHNPEQWGVPRQAWSSPQKILWLLRVATAQLSIKELSGPAIAAVFNKHFRQAGTLQTKSMSRDLGALKQRSPALVCDDPNQTPIAWFLTEEGMKDADKLVAEAKTSV
jgi:hypothetical protein